MMKEAQSESPTHFPESKRSVFSDADLLKKRYKEETKGIHRAEPPRFSFPAASALFWAYIAVLTAAAYWFIPRFLPDWPLAAVHYAAAVIVPAGYFNITAVYYCKKKFGALVEMTVSSVLRTGIPLVAVLVFYLAIDTILLKPVVLTLFGFYILTLPFEVWLFLPRSKAGSESSSMTQTEDRE